MMRSRRNVAANVTRFDLSVAAQRAEAYRKKNPTFDVPPTPGRRIDPKSPEGLRIAKRFSS